MKFLGSQLSYFFANRRTRTNVVKLLKFIAVLVLMYAAYSVLFHYIALYEGQEHSWITGFYWVLVTMSTLGFGDIVFSSDLGRAYSMLVLFSGVLFLLVMLPFTFIEFFYAPWMKAMNQARAPKKLPEGTREHVIITHLDAITEALIKKLVAYKIEYAILEPDLQKALDLADAGYTVVNSDPTDYETSAGSGASIRLGIDRLQAMSVIACGCRATDVGSSANATHIEQIEPNEIAENQQRRIELHDPDAALDLG